MLRQNEISCVQLLSFYDFLKAFGAIKKDPESLRRQECACSLPTAASSGQPVPSQPQAPRQTCHWTMTPQFCASWAPLSHSLCPHCHLYFPSGKQQDETPSAHQALWFHPMGCSQKAYTQQGLAEEKLGAQLPILLLTPQYTAGRLASRRKHLQDIGEWCSPEQLTLWFPPGSGSQHCFGFGFCNEMLGCPGTFNPIRP